MSLKIYNGYKLKLKTFKEINDFVLDFREKVNLFTKEEYTNLVLKRLIRALDDSKLINKELFEKRHLDEETFENLKDSRIITHICRELEKEFKEIKATGIRNNYIDFNCEIVLIPDHNEILAMLYTEKEKIIDIFKSYEFVKEFGYWNNVDKEDNVSHREWNDRKEVWERIFAGYKAPNEVGTAIIINEQLPNYFKLNLKSKLNSIKTTEERANKLAKSETINEVLKQKELEGDKGYSAYIDTVEEFNEGKHDDIHSRFLEDIKNKIDIEINEEILNLKYQDLY